MACSRLTLAYLSLVVLAPAASHAANYQHPYTNVDPRNDAGNDTGDHLTEVLNNAQLHRPSAHPGPIYPAYPSYLTRVPPPGSIPPSRYYTPPPGYVVAPAYPAYGYGW